MNNIKILNIYTTNVNRSLSNKRDICRKIRTIPINLELFYIEVTDEIKFLIQGLYKKGVLKVWKYTFKTPFFSIFNMVGVVQNKQLQSLS